MPESVILPRSWSQSDWSEGSHYNYKTNFSFIFNQTCIRINECKIYGRLIKNNLFQWALTHTPGVISFLKHTRNIIFSSLAVKI